jgi:hypothetical protein
MEEIMAIQRDLQKLAILKIRVDLLTAQYKKEADALKKEMLEKHDTIQDPDGVLSLGLIENCRRSFSVEGVRKTLGGISTQCISEEVDAKKFDALTTQKGKSTLTPAQQAACFSTTPVPQLEWKGMDQFKGALAEKLKD